MRRVPRHSTTDEAVVRRMVTEHPWAILVSAGSGGLLGSHYPVMLDDSGDELALLTHLGRPDDLHHELAAGHEIMAIIQGPHGYVSPSWYAPGAIRVPTWNYSAAHLYGVPQLLSADENVEVLTRLVAHFEQHVERPMLLEPEVAAKVAPGTVGMRLPVTRFTCKAKLSQDKDARSREQVVAELLGDGPYRHPELAAEMQRAIRESPS